MEKGGRSLDPGGSSSSAEGHGVHGVAGAPHAEKGFRLSREAPSPKVPLNQVRYGKAPPILAPLKTRSQAFPRRSSPLRSDEGVPPSQPPLIPGSSSPMNPTFASWAHIFRAANPSSASSPALSKQASATLSKIHEVTSDEVTVDPELLEYSRNKWRRSLLGKFLGRPPPTHIILRDAKAQWDLAGDLSVLEMAGGFFCFRFSDDFSDDYLRVLADGPWSLGGRVISLMPWREDFHPLTEKIVSAPVWLRFEALPQEYWHEQILESLANCFGKFLKIDEFTLRNEKARFARVCVEVDLSKPLKVGARIGPPGRLFFQSVAYENLPVFCYNCGHIGHHVSSCPLMVKDVDSSGIPIPASVPSSATDEMPSVNPPVEVALPDSAETPAGHGPWLRVERRRGNAPGSRLGRRSVAGFSRSPSAAGRREESFSRPVQGEAVGNNDINAQMSSAIRIPRGSFSYGRRPLPGSDNREGRSKNAGPRDLRSAAASAAAGKEYNHSLSNPEVSREEPKAGSSLFRPKSTPFGSSAPTPILGPSEDPNLALVVVEELNKVYGLPSMDIDGYGENASGKGKRGRSPSAKFRRVSDESDPFFLE